MSEVPAVVLRYIAALKAHDVAQVATTVSDGIVFLSLGRKLQKRDFLAFLTALYAALPDWSYDHDLPQVREDGTIAIKWRQGGTHTGTFALAGMPPLAPTGRKVQIPEQFFFYKVANDEIIEIRPDLTTGGAPWGILDQLGVSMRLF
jgi:predicted ester cyclase